MKASRVGVGIAAELRQSRGRFRPAPLVFRRSGWFLVRAIARVPETFRFASTGPFYVEVGGRPRTVRREDVEFFLKWIARLDVALRERNRIPSAAERDRVAAQLEAARAVYARLATR